MNRKPKTPQKESLTEVNGRDTFQTPDYATDIIIPFLAKLLRVNVIWECAAGLGKISKRLVWDGFDVVSTDLAYLNQVNFLTDKPDFDFDAIVTNPPFSLKRRFFMKCVEYDKPFGLLIPADYSGWLIEAVDKYGCEKIVPTRRIDYVTPDILNRIHEGELFEMARRTEELPISITLKKYRDMFPGAWEGWEGRYPTFHLYDSIYSAPTNLLRKYSSSMFHSMWLTRYFNIGRTETFIELTNEQKEII